MTEYNDLQDENKRYEFEPIKCLNFGANPHQNAGLYRQGKLADYEVCAGGDLSYLNIINITQAMNIVSEFFDVNAAVIVKNGTTCGVALGKNIYDAYTKAFDCDPVSAFFGTIGFSKKVDVETAKHISSMAVEAVIAPDFEPQALKLLSETRFTKVVKLNTPLEEYRSWACEDIMMTPFGTLIQDKNKSELDKDLFKVVTKTKPMAEQIEDAIFAWKIAKHTKSSSAVIAKDFKTVAIGQGQPNSVSVVEQALNFACDGSKNAVLAFDEPIPTAECIYAAAQGRIGLIIQPGGALKDAEIIAAADKYNIVMITTGVRNLRI